MIFVKQLFKVQEKRLSKHMLCIFIFGNIGLVDVPALDWENWPVSDNNFLNFFFNTVVCAHTCTCIQERKRFLKFGDNFVTLGLLSKC